MVVLYPGWLDDTIGELLADTIRHRFLVAAQMLKALKDGNAAGFSPLNTVQIAAVMAIGQYLSDTGEILYPGE